VVIAGFNPLAVDWTATLLMGLDPSRIPMYAIAQQQMREWVPDFQPTGILVRSNLRQYESVISQERPIFRFACAPGWRGKIEKYPPDSGSDTAVQEFDPILQ